MESSSGVDMRDMPLRWGHFRVLIVASLGQVTGAAIATLVGVVIPMVQIALGRTMSVYAQGAVGSVSLVGIMVGSLVFGRLSDRYGYLFFFRLCPIIVFCAAMGAYFADSLVGLIVGLFFMGLGVGGGYSLDSDYISEIMPTRWKLLMVGVAKASSAIGNIATAAICFVALRHWDSAAMWNRLLLIVAVVAAAMIVMRIFSMHAPGWLIAHGRADEAERVVKRLLGRDVYIGGISSRHIQHEGTEPTWRDMFRGKNLRRVIFGGVPWACEGFGVYGVGTFMPIIIMSLGLGAAADSSRYAHVVGSVEMSAYINIFVLVGFVVGLLVVNRWYHVRVQTWGFVLCAVALAVMVVAYKSGMPMWVAVAGFMLFELFLNAGPHLMTFIIPPQIYPVEERSTGAGLSAFFGKAGAVVGVLFVPVLVGAGGAELALAVTLGVQLVGAAVTALFGRKVLPRQADVSPE